MSPIPSRRSLPPLSQLAYCLLLLLIAPAFASPPHRPSSTAAACNASIAQCLAVGEFLMDSEINRRMLQDGSHIGYGALNPDKPACDGGRGKAYSCGPGRSNRRTRPCNTYYQCRTGNSR